MSPQDSPFRTGLLVAITIIHFFRLSCTLAQAHTTQTAPAEVLIYPRTNFLILRISGVASDLSEAATGHQAGKTLPKLGQSSLNDAESRRDAAYLEDHVFLE
jgi:hypothetical protein